MEGELVKFPQGRGAQPVGLPTFGSAGLRTQLPGGAATVSNLASATGGVGPGNMAQRDTK